MLSGIKDRILNVTKTVSFLGNDEKSSKFKDKPGVNFDAGAQILEHFQSQWEVLHKQNEENAEQASQAAKKIEDIWKKVSSNRQNIQTITQILKHSNITSNISHCLDQINELYKVCEEVEKGLCEFENLIEEVEFEKMKRHHKFHLESYRERKEGAIDSLEHDLHENYNRKVQDYETSKKSILEERQKVFQEAFKCDLEVYKSLGTIPKMDLPKNGALLEEIELDFDESELDKFFNSSSDSNQS